MNTTEKSLSCLILAALSLGAAEVQQVKGRASAPIGATLKNGDTFATRSKSQSQVGMNRSFFRVGSDSQVKLENGQRLVMEKGVMLVGSDPGRRRQTVEVSVPGYRMRVSGTIQVAYYPGQYLKVTVLEGKVTVALQSLAGEFEELVPGQMLIINPSDKNLPEPVEVDLGRIMSTSQLISSPSGAPTTKNLMDAAAVAQGGDRDLQRTPFMFRGASPEMLLLVADNAAGGRVLADEQSVFKLKNDLADTTANVTQKSYADGLSYLSFPFPSTEPSITLTRTGARTKELTVLLTSATDDFGGYMAPAELHGTIRADSDIFSAVDGKKLIFESHEFGADPFNDYSLQAASGTDIKTPSQVGLGILGALGVTINTATLKAGDSTHADELLDIRATERDINILQSTLNSYSLTIAGSTVNSGPVQNITLDQTAANARSNVNIGLPTARSRVTFSNSTQLASLLGHLMTLSNGGEITVENSSLAAAGTLTLDSLDTSDAGANGFVTLRNASLAADVIRVRASTPGGDQLLIEGGTFDADSLLKFYAGSSSKLLFRGNVVVNSPVAVFSGQAVQVDLGGNVQVSGRADVYSDNHLYNLPGFGTMNAGGGIIQQPQAAAPDF